MMFDINKYKGHDDWEDTKVNMANEANKQLIADAPKLLAEVKRLREAFITAIRYLDVESRNKMFENMDADLQSIWLFRSE